MSETELKPCPFCGNTKFKIDRKSKFAGYNGYITPNYETISTSKKRRLCELMGSSLINAFTEQDFIDVLLIFERVIDRLEAQAEGE